MNAMPAPFTSEGELGGTLMLVEEISHRVLNDYTRAISSMNMAAALCEDFAARRALAQAADDLRAQADAHRVLQAPRAGEIFDLGAYLEKVCATMSASYLAQSNIRLTLIQSEVCLPSSRCWRVGLIVSELVRNAARHGLSYAAGDILIDVAAKEEQVSCRVSDSGRSSDAPPMGRGRTLIEGLARELGGSVEWLFQPSGASVRLIFPQRPQ